MMPEGAGADETLRRAVIALADELVADRIQTRAGCTWLVQRSRPGDRFVIGPAGPFLYEGGSGIALFLASANRCLGIPEFADAARNALRHVLASFVDASDPRHQVGLYQGWLGVAVVGAVVARAIADDDLWESFRGLAESCATPSPDPLNWDLISGAAGSIPAYLTLFELFEAEVFLQAAVGTGDLLLATAAESRDGLWWGQVDNTAGSGLAHGSSGMAAALGLLGRRTALERFSRASRNVLRFDASAALPDWDEGSAHPHPDRHGMLGASGSWCYGLVGHLMAASWITGQEISPELREVLDRVEAEAVALVRTDTQVDGCLCHGLAGLAECLLREGRFSAAYEIAVNCRLRWVRRSGLAGPYPRHSLGLMTGWSGIGLLLLHCCESDPLLRPLHPWQWPDMVAEGN